MSESLGPAVAGSWYPAGPAELTTEVDRHLARAARDGGDAGDAPAALIAPHAGYIYSGAVAACGFARLPAARFERVVLIGPSHHFRFVGATLPRASSYRTPLGEVPIDREAIDGAPRGSGARLDDEPFAPEHSLEAELPFLQRRLEPGWRLVPVLLGAGTVGEPAERVADLLRPMLGPRTLVVVSSDFTHYGPRFGFVPFRDELPERIERLDMGAVESILAGDRDGFEEYVARTGATICGRDAIGVMLRLLPGLTGELARYDTSGRITGDWSHSVSYASLTFHDPGH